MGIVEFLEARLTEDEAVATAATGLNWRWKPELGDDDDSQDQGPWLVSDKSFELSGGGSYSENVLSTWVTGAWGGLSVEDSDAAHMVRHDPARILREVAAKRELLELHYDGNPGPGDIHYCGTCHDYYMHQAEDWPCETVRVLASTFSDHPDFNEEWRP